MTQQATTTNLEVLENRAEQALEKAETGWREFAEAMRAIKESDAHREAGYRYFQTYYREQWEERTGRSFLGHTAIIRKLAAVEEFEEALGQPREVDLPKPGAVASEVLKNRLPEPTERVEAWQHHLSTGREMGKDREGLRQSIAEYKGEPGVIEQAEERGLEVPEMPQGPTLPEQAYIAITELAILSKKVPPVEAARAHPAGAVAAQIENLETFAHWAKLFVEEAYLYTEEYGDVGSERH